MFQALKQIYFQLSLKTSPSRYKPVYAPIYALKRVIYQDLNSLSTDNFD